MRIFASTRIFASRRICEANICSEANNCFNFYCFASNRILFANLCEYFEANLLRMMRINGVCEYIEACEYEANKIHVRLDALEANKKKLRILRTLDVTLP